MSEDTKKTVLIVDDEQEVLDGLTTALYNVYNVLTATTASEAAQIFAQQNLNAIVVDIALYGDTDTQGLDLIRKLRSQSSDVILIACSGQHDVDIWKQAEKAGADNYCTKKRNFSKELSDILLSEFDKREHPFDSDKWNFKDYGDYGMTGTTPAMNKLRNQIKGIVELPKLPATIYIHGETGTGKKLVAEAIYANSSRKDKPFIVINSKAISDSIADSELFGHEKRAFTGATEQKIGKIEAANGGILFFDEIGDMSWDIQTKLLLAVQDKQFYRVGGHEIITVDVIFICATNKNLTQEIAEGRFKEDFYHRISQFQIVTPPLRQRKEDIPSLANLLIGKFNSEQQTTITLEPNAGDYIKICEWTGNIRELENAIERICISVNREGRNVITLADVTDVKESPHAIENNTVVTSTPAVSSPTSPTPPLASSSVTKTTDEILTIIKNELQKQGKTIIKGKKSSSDDAIRESVIKNCITQLNNLEHIFEKGELNQTSRPNLIVEKWAEEDGKTEGTKYNLLTKIRKFIKTYSLQDVLVKIFPNAVSWILN